MRAETANHPLGRLADVGLVAKRVALVDVGQMNLDHGQFRRLQRIENGDRGMAVGRGINDDAVLNLPRLLDPANDLTFQVALAKVDRQAQIGSPVGTRRFQVGQRVGAVDGRFPKSQHVEIRAVDDQHALLVVGHQQQ